MKDKKLKEQFAERLKNLNPEQRKAVATIDGPVLVIAGPGSGKTEILSLRVANILQKTDTHPGSILCLTFTESAASNMRERLSGLIGTDAYRVQIHTFHSFGVNIINRFPEFFFGSAEFNPADTVTQMETIFDVIEALPSGDPLRSEHPEQGFVFVRPVLSAISNLKRSGLSPEEFKKILTHNTQVLELLNPLIDSVFTDRLSKKDFNKIEEVVQQIKTVSQSVGVFPVPHMHPLSDLVADSLSLTLKKAKEEDKTAPLSAWKTSWTTKSDTGVRVLKDTERTARMHSLAAVYEAYCKNLYAKGYYDFDDMLLETIHSIEKNPSLILTLQEEFQYLLVDEFQDTNDAQMRLLRLLTSAAVHEGRPNILAVGDADQAIYKFQGAEIANMLQFKEMYRDPIVISLSKNYRSSQEILDLATDVISQSEQSLESFMPEVKKILTAGRKFDTMGHVVFRDFPTYLHEYQWIASEVRKLLDAGTSPSDIAIISRTHYVLQRIVPFLRSENIPISYDKQQDVLELCYIRELITVVRFAVSVAENKQDEADFLLPEILSFAWWNLSRKLIWQISIESRDKNISWLSVMESHSDSYVRSIATFLINLGVVALSEPVERILDIIIGSSTLEMTDSEDDDDVEPDAFTEPTLHGFHSPFREHYFGKKILTNKGDYITFLSGLRVFIQSLREYKQGTVLSSANLVEFVDIYEKNNMSLLDTSPFMSSATSVELLTAHKAKGLEFGVVFVTSATDEVWTGGGKGDILPFPRNLPIRPGGDNRDDMLRLLYVALTRAKHTLYMSYHTQNEKGRSTLPVEFLSHLEIGDSAFKDEKNNVPTVDKINTENIEKSETHPLESAWGILTHGPYESDEQAMLTALVENYCMPITHLNNFLDITRGGPRLFLEQNLLRFPQAKTVSSVFGTAMHAVMQYVHTYLRREGVVPNLSRALEVFNKQITAGRLNSTDQRVQCERGEKALTLYFTQHADRFSSENKIETDFKHQGVCLGGARVTGKIDKIIFSGNEATVVDFKTGKAKLSWDATGHEAVQLYAYRKQLLFYKLLIEHSKDYKQYHVSRGVLEFLEPYKDTLIDLELEMDEGETKRLQDLAEAVYTKICVLDFPDVTGYSADLKGIKDFEEDLLSGKV